MIHSHRSPVSALAMILLVITGCQSAPLNTTPGLSSSDLHQQKLNEVLANGGKKKWWTRGTKATPVSVATDQKIPSTAEDLQNPDRLFYLHGVLHERSGNLKQAGESFEKAMAHNPEMTEAQVGLARIRIAENKLTEAQNLLMDAQQKTPDSAIVWHGISRLYQSQKESPRAIQALRKAIQSDPRQAAYLSELASLLVSQGEHQLAYDELRTRSSEADAAFTVAAMIYQAKTDLKLAQQYLNYALRVEPQHDQAQKLMASVNRDIQYATIVSRERGAVPVRQVSAQMPAQ